MSAEEAGIWYVHVNGHADNPVKVMLDREILELLWSRDKAAWMALLEFLDGHIRSRERENP